MANWTTTYEDTPAGNTSPTLGDDHMRDIKAEVRQRVDQEHVFLNTASTGATVHRSGAAVCYFQDSEPTLRPDGVTALTTGDSGRLWIDSNNNNSLKVYDDVAGDWEDVAIVGAAGDFTVSGDLTVGDDLIVTDNVVISGYIRIEPGGGRGFATGGEDAPDCVEGGICLNQGSDSGHILTFKSSAVAHGITAVAETDTYGLFELQDSTYGGLSVEGFSEWEIAVQLYAVATDENTITNQNAAAPISLSSRKKYGNGFGPVSDNANILVVKNSVYTRFLVKGDGDIYYDGANQGSYDNEDDLALVKAANRFKVDSPGRKRLEELGIIVNGFVSNRKMSWLTLGAIGQLYEMFKAEVSFLRDKIAILEGAV